MYTVLKTNKSIVLNNVVCLLVVGFVKLFTPNFAAEIQLGIFLILSSNKSKWRMRVSNGTPEVDPFKCRHIRRHYARSCEADAVMADEKPKVSVQGS